MTVYLVGAGPGDPGLLTRRGEELLRRAGGRRVRPARVARAPRSRAGRGRARRRREGARPRRHDPGADQRRCSSTRGKDGLEVVRLKGGDPFVFGRGGEEAEACRDAGVAYEVVPGITSAIAAAAYAGIPVTHRGLATSFTVVTGHEDPAKGTTDTDWDALARAGGTLVVLMGAGRVADIAEALIAGGRAPGTPVAAVRWGTRPEQRTLRGTLATIAELGRGGAERDRDRRGRRSRSRLVRAAPVVRSAHRRHPRPGAGERAARPARGARRGSDRAARRSRSNRWPSSFPTSRATTGSSSPRPTASTPSSTAGSRPRAATPARWPGCASP